MRKQKHLECFLNGILNQLVVVTQGLFEQNKAIVCVCVCVCVCVLVSQSRPTLCEPMDCSSPGSTVHGILQTRILEEVVISFSRGSSLPQDWTQVSYIAGRFSTSESLGKPNEAQFSSVQLLSHFLLFATPWTAARQVSLPSSTTRVYPNPCPLSQWCHPIMSSSVVPFSHLQSFPASGSFQMSQLSASGGQSIGVSASTSVLPMNTQDWSPLGWTGWISLQYRGLSRVFSNTTVQKHQFFSAQLSSQSNSHIHTWPLEKP